MTEHRLAELRRRASHVMANLHDDRTLLLRESLDELAEALEELQVAGEELARQSATIYDSQRRYQELFAMSPDGVVESDRAGRIIETNLRVAGLLGVPATDLVGQPLARFVDRRDHTALDRALAESGSSSSQSALIVKVCPPDRPCFPASLTVAAIGGDDGGHFLWAIRDITEQRRLEAQLERQATHDALSGLFNRDHFLAKLDAALDAARCGREAQRIALFFIDLDRFKSINDRYGHHVGDEALTIAGGRLSLSECPGDLAARIGGDEFAVACEGVAGEDEALGVAERIRALLEAPAKIGRATVRIGATVGVAISSEASTATDLLRGADNAMYLGKERGRGRSVFFGSDLRRRMQLQSELENDLEEAIAGRQLRLVYQPQVAVGDGQIKGVEALVRWDHPTRGLLEAAEFITIAEATGMVADIDRWVLGQACDDASHWVSAASGHDVVVSINMSPLGLSDVDLVEAVRSALDRNGLAPRLLCLEITERSAVDNTPETLKVLRALRHDGVRLAIDDFGTGYSSLGYLRDLPITTLKIDQSFVNHIGTSPHDRLIVAATTRMAGALGLTTIAEGVETAAQLQDLVAVGCDQIQGDLVASPQSGEEIGHTLQRRFEAPRWSAALGAP